ncbi:ABC transporter ATP-binding protein [Rhizobium sp. SSA_523]|uniref:ABC transporter ATP-binding protein n=1 Tax=Rhizobium sp. SSA_523 TaxID=2952477 RepID=UPI002090907F|nr:ABC transporter ATP-binding protein [Rhizobium sp. SSA_523]MCO5731608.1 ABC transporter ATP-binding protein [Rhizobium sp. SSA_523]WKC21879.1 ABC transporter ATP-binding protein [Rhizobium sp. SSA_523]
MSSITLENIRKSYGRSGPAAISNLNLEIGTSEFLCLLGPSGCGKTTTLRMIAGLEHPTDGRILVDGKPIVSVAEGIFTVPEKRNMGLVFQNYALWPHMTIRDNVAFGLTLRKMPAADRDAIVDQVMTTLGIARYAERYPAQLSGGQQQRVALARMLALKPSVILLDEPLSNLDAKLRLEMRAELKRIHAEAGSTIVFVTHDQWEAMTLATTIAVMSEGELQQVGTPDDIYERPANRFVAEFVGSLPINIIERAEAQSGPLNAWLDHLLAHFGVDGAAVASAGIRPEATGVGALFAEDAAKRAAGQGIVVDIVPTGGSWIVELDVQGSRVFAIVTENPRIAAGQSSHFWVERQHLHLFDREKRRITA